MSIIGIDLGTTNSAVAATDAMGITTTIAARDGSRTLPSAVYFEPSDEVSIGARAKSMAVMEPERVAMLFKRGMGEKTFLTDGSAFAVDGKVWRPEELSSLVLKKLKQIAEENLSEPVTGAIVTVPAYFGELERSATRDEPRWPVFRCCASSTSRLLPRSRMDSVEAHARRTYSCSTLVGARSM